MMAGASPPGRRDKGRIPTETRGSPLASCSAVARASALPGVSRAHSAYFLATMSRSSTSKIKVALGGMLAPAPRSP